MKQQITPYRLDNATKKDQVATMFNNISGTYDFLNHFLSLGIDVLWRKKAIKELVSTQPRMILDVATGTGDFAFEAIKKLAPEKVVGVDISDGMLDVARQKISQRNLQAIFSVQLGDSEGLQFEENTFDAITVAFGVRNFENLEKGLADMFRVLKPDGKIVILEFSKPKVFPVKQAYQFYFKRVTPFFGKVFSKDKRAYEYLPESVAAFPDGEEFLSMLRKVGFKKPTQQQLTFGISSIYVGVK